MFVLNQFILSMVVLFQMIPEKNISDIFFLKLTMILCILISILLARFNTVQFNGVNLVTPHVNHRTSDFSIFSGLAWTKDISLGDANASFIGEWYEESGRSVAGAGDVNNDGFADIIIGAPHNEKKGTQTGQTYLLFGRSTSNWKKNMALSDADVTFTGEDSLDLSGCSVAGAGDVNNDGFSDFLIGAYGDEEGGGGGQTYLLFGRPTAKWPKNVDLSQANASCIGV